MMVSFTQLTQSAARFIGTDQAKSFAENSEQMRKDIAAADKATKLAKERAVDREWRGEA